MDSAPATTNWTQRLEEVRKAAQDTPVTRPRGGLPNMPSPTDSAPPSDAGAPDAGAPAEPPSKAEEEQLVRAQRMEQLPKEWQKFIGQIPEGARIYVGEAPPLVTGESKPDKSPEPSKKEEAAPTLKPQLPAQPIPAEVEAACGELCAHLKEAELKGIYKQCMDTCQKYVTGR